MLASVHIPITFLFSATSTATAQAIDWADGAPIKGTMISDIKVTDSDIDNESGGGAEL